jgi:hypothetical protein
VIALDEADVLHAGTDLDDQGRALDLEILDDRDGVAIGQHAADGVTHHAPGVLFTRVRGGLPLVPACRTDESLTVEIGETGAAVGAGRQADHEAILEARRRDPQYAGVRMSRREFRSAAQTEVSRGAPSGISSPDTIQQRRNMPVARLERILETPRDYCWAWLADFNALQFLHPPGNLVEFSCEGSHVGARRFARFKPEMGVEGLIIERLDVVHAPDVIVYSIVEHYPLPMRDYVAVVTMTESGAAATRVTWEGHYTEHGLPAAQMDQMLRDFYTLFLDNIEKACALGRKPGESPY